MGTLPHFPCEDFNISKNWHHYFLNFATTGPNEKHTSIPFWIAHLGSTLSRKEHTKASHLGQMQKNAKGDVGDLLRKY